MIHRLKEHLQYRLISFLSKGAMTQILALLVFAILVVLIGSIVYAFGLFEENNLDVQGIEPVAAQGENFLSAIWWSARQLIDSGYFGLNAGASLPVVLVSFFLTIMGLVILASLIGFISNSIDALITYPSTGRGVVLEREHILLLGWNSKVASILKLLGAHQPSVKIAILAPKSVPEMQEALRTAGIHDRKMKIILRSGIPSNIAELKRMSFQQAQSILVLASECIDSAASDRDIEAIKTLMILSSFDEWAETPPNIVCEVSQQANHEIATIAGREQIPIVASNQVISKVLVQSARQTGISDVYARLFAFGGNTIYVQTIPACVDREFGEIAHEFPQAIPIGISWSQPTKYGSMLDKAGLNPEPDYEIADDERLILIAPSAQIEHRSVSAATATIEPVVQNSHQPTSHDRSLSRVMILGWNTNIYNVLTELDGHTNTPIDVVIVADLPADEATSRLEQYVSSSLKHVKVTYHRADVAIGKALRRLDVPTFDAIITLADESHIHADPDARTITALLVLSDILQNYTGSAGSDKDLPHIVSEILDPRNKELVTHTCVNDIIVSSEIVSTQLAQISQQSVLDSIYRELLSAGGMEIQLKPIERYARVGISTSFATLVAAAQPYSEVAIGVQRTQTDSVSGLPNNEGGIELNPPKDSSWTFDETDNVIVLAQQIYD